MANVRAVVCRVELDLGPSLPPAELARRDSALLGKLEVYFPLRRMQIVVGNILSMVIKLEYLWDSMVDVDGR